MAYGNIYDQLSEAGQDDWLDAFRSTPKPQGFPEDVGKAFDVVVQNHLALLELNEAIKAKWNENDNWLNAYGLPVAYEDRGDLRVLRAQRAVFQQWMIEVPWASAGQVVISNGGDDFKDAGQITQAALITIPAESYITFDSNRDGAYAVYRTDSAGTDALRLSPSFSGDDVEAQSSWSPDGKKIAFVRRVAGNADIWTMNADGSGRSQLTVDPAGDVNPNWSPDGTRIAFQSNRGGSADIYVMKADGTGVVRLTTSDAGDFAPVWSPDGKQIAFASNAAGSSDIYVMNADDTSITQLTDTTAVDRSPSWSPDGRRIVFACNEADNWEIWTMSAEGTAQTNITSNAAHDLRPSWSPDGDKIAFDSAREGDIRVFTTKPDGTDVTRITKGPEHDVRPLWSPRARR